MERSQFMDGALCCFHSHGLIQTAIQGRAVTTSLLEYALSSCGVTSRDRRRASRAPLTYMASMTFSISSVKTRWWNL